MIEARPERKTPRALVFVLGRRPEQIIGPSQQLAVEFAKHLPVLYVMVDRLVWHVPGMRSALPETPWDGLVPSDSLRIISQYPEPSGMSRSSIARNLFGRLTATRIRRELKHMGVTVRETAFFIYHPEPAHIVRHFPEAYWHYHCIDDFVNWHSNRPGVGKLLGRLERYLAVHSNTVSATSKALVRRMESWHSPVVYSPNGVEIARFVESGTNPDAIPQDMVPIPRPIFGFVGATPGYIDCDLIKHAANMRPSYSFVFVGPLDSVKNRLNDLRNIWFLGAKPYAHVAEYMHAFDVCLLPASKKDASVAQNTGKQHQYMATGKPVVAVDLPEIEEYRDLMYVGNCKGDFVKQLDLSLSDPPEMFQKRVKRAENASWGRRAVFLLDIIFANYGNDCQPALVRARHSGSDL